MNITFEVDLSAEKTEEIDKKLRKAFPQLVSWSFRYADNTLTLEFPDAVRAGDFVEKVKSIILTVYPNVKFKEVM